MRKPVVIAVLLLAAAVVLVVVAPVATIAQEVQSVFITNWPKVLSVTGSITVDGPVKHAKLAAVREIVVPPVSPKDTVRLIQGGTIESDGFTNMVLSLQGQIKGEIYKPGTVGVFLLPDEEVITRAFDEKGIMQFSQEIAASGVSSAAPYFAAAQGRAPIGFQRYRTYFYNTTDKTVTVNLFAYLTN
jgi:hypothetical protein